MGIYVDLVPEKRLTLREQALIRLYYGFEALKFFTEGQIFSPKSVEIWLWAPSKALDGVLKETLHVDNVFKTYEDLRDRFEKKYPLEDIVPSIIRVNGTWDFDDFMLAGFFSVNNSYVWRRSYFDIEIDAYGKGTYEDVVNALWEKADVEAVITAFVTALERSGKLQPAKPGAIYFSIGVPTDENLSDILAMHVPSRRALISFLYSALCRTEDPWISTRVAPIKSRFFVNSIADQEIVQKRLEMALQEAAVIEKKGASVTYIAKEPGSFSKMFEKFTETVFKPALRDLPEAETLRNYIQRGLTGTTQLF